MHTRGLDVHGFLNDLGTLKGPSELLPLKLVGDLKWFPKGVTARLRATVEAWPTITIDEAPYSLWNFTDGRSLDSFGNPLIKDISMNR